MNLKKITRQSISARPLVGKGLLLTLFVLFLSLQSFRVAATNTWTGLGGNHLWFNAGNWSGGIPGPGDDVDISNSGDVVDFVGNVTVGINSLSVASGASLNIHPQGVIVVTNGMTQAGQIHIYSDATGDGTLRVNGAPIIATGQLLLERFITGGKWHMIAPSVVGETTTWYTSYYLKPWTESANNYGSLITSTTQAITNGTGLACFSSVDATIGNSGGFTNSPVTTPCPFTDASHGFTLVGNPYTAGLDLSVGAGFTLTNLASTVWFWDPTAGNYTTNTIGTGAGVGPNRIAVGQGFFVQATSAGASIGFNKNALDISYGTFLKTKASSTPFLKVSVSNDVNTYSDAAFVCQIPDAISGIDYRYDAKKIMGLPEAPQLYTNKSNTNFTTTALSSIDQNTVIPLYLKAGVDGNYTLNFENTLGLTGMDILLHDSKLNTTNTITSNFVYTCQASASDDSARFTILVKPVATGIKSIDQASVKVWSNNNLLYVDVPAGETLNLVNLFDVTGAKVASFANNRGTGLNTISLNNLSQAMYFVQVYTNNQVSINKIAIH